MLAAYGVAPAEPCNYSFPISSWEDFAPVARDITTVGVSALITFVSDLAETEPTLVGPISSLLAVSARHNSFLLREQGQIPDPQAFDTGVPMLWAYNFALQYFVPGSCSLTAPLPMLPPLEVQINQTQPQPASTVNLAWEPALIPAVIAKERPLYAAWVNQLSGPVYTNITMEDIGKGYASIPPFLTGVVYVAITSQQLTETSLLEWGSVAGPALIYRV